MISHLLSIADLSKEQAINILDTAEELARITETPVKKLPTLRGRTIVNLFFEDSTRTFELLWGQDLPEGVAISEAVELAKTLSTDDSATYINGVLAAISEIKTTLSL